MNSNAYPQSYPASSSNPLSPSQQSVNPAFLAAFQNQQASAASPSKFSNNVYPGSANSASINPSQLMNGMNPMQMSVNGAGAINPAQLLSQQHPMNGNAMSMGMGNMGNMNMNMNMGMSNMMPSAGGMSINPAALSAGGSHPAASLPNNMNAAAMNMNHQQQSNPAFLGMGMGNMGHMNPMANAGMGSMGMGNMNMMPNSNFAQNSNSMMTMNQPTPTANPNTLSVLNAMGISPQQFASMSPQERQALGQRVMAMQHHAREQQQQHHQQQMSGRVPNFERPSSSASTHSNHAPQQQQQSPASAGPSANPPPTPTSVQPHQPQPQHYHQNSMMPPPPTPTRPLTAQSQAAQSLSRPGTSMSHHSPGGASSIARPPSRATPAPDSGPPPNSAGSNGFMQQQQGGKPGQGGNPYPQGQSQGQGSPPPPGSPYRGAKRKLGDVPGSPRIGHGGMGPPQGLPRNGSMDAMMGGPMGMNMSNMVGMQGMGMQGMNAQVNGQMHSPSAGGGQLQAQQQQQQQQQQMMNAIAAQRQSPRPQSAHGHHVGGMPGMGPMGMNMGGMGMPGMQQNQQNHQSQSQAQQQQQQSMVQHGGQQQHGGQHGQQQQQPGQQSRQSSVPPTAQFSTPPQQPHQPLPMNAQAQQQHQVGMNGMGGMGMGMGGMPMNVGVGGMGGMGGNMGMGGGMSGMGVGVGGGGMNPANVSANLPQTMPSQPLMVHQLVQQQMAAQAANAAAAAAANGQAQQQQQQQGQGQQGISQMMSSNSAASAASQQQQQPQHSPIRQSSVPPTSSSVSGAAAAPTGLAHPVTPTKGVGAEAIIKTEGLRSSVPPSGIPPLATAPAAVGGTNVVNGIVGATVPGPIIPPTVPAPTIPALPPLPPIDTRVTKVTIVPLASSQTTIPPLTPTEIESVKEWMRVDKEYDGLVKKMEERMKEEIRETLGVGAVGWGANVGWWEKGSRSVSVSRWRARNLMAASGGRVGGGGEGFEIRYPRKMKDPSQRRKNGRREGIKLPRKVDPEVASRPEQLVPIRLEFDVEHHKMRETFVWNLNDPVITPELFAQTLVEDYNLTHNYYAIIHKSIHDQLNDYKAHHVNYDTAEEGERRVERVADPQLIAGRGTLDEDGLLWWEEWRKRLRKTGGKYEEESTTKRKGKGKNAKPLTNGATTDRQAVEGEMEVDAASAPKGGEKPLAVNEFSLDENQMHEEMRILVKLDIISGSMKLDDQFEWDLESPNASPEEFAEIYCQDLGLGGEFKTAIAHSIREQVQTYQKSLFLVGHPSDGSVIQDDDLRSAFLPSLSSGARTLDQVQSFTPTLNYLSDGEIERSEKDRDKDMTKRRKRNMRGRRGVALPDREPIRTYRTPAIGFPELDPQVVAAAIAANAPMSSRRAAAQAALVNIENMVASENKSSFSPQMVAASLPVQPMPQPQPQVQQPQQATMTTRDKDKTKGLFKAPSLPSSVLKPRANVTTPTPSTAADVTKLPAPLENDPPPPPVVVPPPPDSKATRVLTAKRVKELEREAKEKEFADGQHPNFINGIWHCSNCGCPESIAVGRRKGPLGDKSQCGTCGKFWHRHRRPRPVEYNSNPDYHSGLLKREAEAAKPAAKKKGGGALRGHSSLATPDVSEPQTPRSRSNGDNEVPSRQSPPPISTAVAAAGLVDDDRPISPVSSTSSASESPLAQKLKVNGSGSHHANASSSSNERTAVGDSTSSNQNDSASSGQDSSTKASAQSPSKASQAHPDPPPWLKSALETMRQKWPNDNFEVSLRKAGAAEWRIRCKDCPGKLYTPGPGETLSNYEVHLKNRQHRQRVNDRLQNSTS